jgi:hypothetical protein
MPFKPHPTDPTKVIYKTGDYWIPKPWVDLTDEDIGDAYVAWDNTDGASFADFARLIEAQLRKKNG